MSADYHPENVFKDRSSALDPKAIHEELISDGYAVALNAGALALTGSLDIFDAIPNLIGAIGQSDAGNIAQYSFGTAFTSAMVVLAIKNIAGYSGRWRQARYNQKFNSLVEQSNLNFDQ